MEVKVGEGEGVKSEKLEKADGEGSNDLLEEFVNKVKNEFRDFLNNVNRNNELCKLSPEQLI